MAQAQAGSKALWMLLAVGTQAVWGAFPVICRYLQNRAAHTLTGLQLSFLMNGLAAVCLLLFHTLPRRLQRGRKRVHAQRGMLLLEHLKHQLGRVRRTASLQSLLHLLRREAEGEPAAALLQPLQAGAADEGAARHRALLKRPSLIEDVTSGGLDAPSRPQAVQVALSLTRSSTLAAPATPKSLRQPAPATVPDSLHYAPATPRAWRPRLGLGPEAAMGVARSWGPSAGGGTRGWGWGPGAAAAAASSPRVGAAGPARWGWTAQQELLPPVTPRSPLGRRQRAVAVDALREPLLSATAESPEGVKQEAGNAWGARLYGGADLEAPEGQPSPFLQDAGEAAAAAEGEEERVQLTLKPFTLHRRWFTPWALAASSTAALATLSLALIFSSRLTNAYWCQMLFMLGPLFVAFICRWMFAMPLPPYLWRTLAVMLAGSALVVLGKGGTSFGLEGLTARDAAGLALALLSALSLAGYMVLVQRTVGLLTAEAILWINYGVQVVLSAGLALALEPREWRRLRQLSTQEWAVVAAVALAVYYGANLAQQLTIRRLGAPLAASFLAVRLVAAVAVSGPLLGEPIRGACEVGGVVLVVGAVTWYLLVQRRLACRDQD